MVPNWVLKQVFGPKRPVFLDKKPSLWPTWTAAATPQKALPAASTGNTYSIPLGEMRFWVAVASLSSNWAQCRACGLISWSQAERLIHNGLKTCQQELVEAYELLARDGVCVICNLKAHTFSYGLPLHSECRRLFYVRAKIDAIEDALMVVRSKQWTQ